MSHRPYVPAMPSVAARLLTALTSRVGKLFGALALGQLWLLHSATLANGSSQPMLLILVRGIDSRHD
jgi:hypothetical protein